MRLHYLQHVPFEDLANIGTWAEGRGHRVSGTLLFEDGKFPRISEFDWLVVMGGPMGVYDDGRYPWFTREKEFIEKAIAGGKIVLGICLGAQLIADVLGGRVYRNVHKEIGWHPVSLTREAAGSSFFNGFPGRFTAFHWHGDTFDIPPGCMRAAESEACANQAFEYNGRVVGLQFHLESSIESIGRLIRNCRDELVQGRYIQSPEEMLSSHNSLQEINRLMNSFLDNIEREFAKTT